MAPQEIEQELCKVSGVVAARVCWDGGTISEVHIAALPGAKPKNIARDVRTYLITKLGLDVDHRKISIALQKPEESAEGNGGGAGEGVAGREARIRLEALTLHVEAGASEVEVLLSAAGRELRGRARGSPSADGLERAVLAATLEALQQRVRSEVRLAAGELRRMRIGAREARLVEVAVCRAHEEQRLLGTCWVRQDPYRAVVMATLNAVNRTLCRLAPMHWKEIRVEPEGAPEERREAP